MYLSHVLVFALSALPLTTCCPDPHFLFGHPDEKDDIINATRRRVEPRYAELLSSKFRHPWPIVPKPQKYNEVWFCYADAKTRNILKTPFEAGIILWETALGPPGEASKHNLKFREILRGGDVNNPVYCYDSHYSDFGTGVWNSADVYGWTLTIHLQDEEGIVSAQSGFTPDGPDSHLDVIGRHWMRIGPDPETKPAMAQPWLVAHEIGHILGMVHEHQRFDRDDFIDFYCNNIHDFPSAFDRATADPVNKKVKPAIIQWLLCNDENYQEAYGFDTSMRHFVKGAGFHQWDNRITTEPKLGPDFDSIMMGESSSLATWRCAHSGAKDKDGKPKLDLAYCTMMMSYNNTERQNIWGPMVSRRKPSARDVRFVQRFYPWPPK